MPMRGKNSNIRYKKININASIVTIILIIIKRMTVTKVIIDAISPMMLNILFSFLRKAIIAKIIPATERIRAVG